MADREPTAEECASARNMGERHARAEQDLDVLFPSEPLEDDDDIRSLAFKVTGTKVDAESALAAHLATEYEEGYWEVWDNG